MLTTIPDAARALLFDDLEQANKRVMARFPGDLPLRQPVHVVYGGAHLFTAGAIEKLGAIARSTLDRYAARSGHASPRALGLDPALARRIYPRLVEKLDARAGRRLPDRLRGRLRQSARRRRGSLRGLDGSRRRGGREERHAVAWHRHPHQAARRGAQTPEPAHVRSLPHRRSSTPPAARCRRTSW